MTFLDVVYTPMDYLYDSVFENLGLWIGVLVLGTALLLAYAFGGKKK